MEEDGRQHLHTWMNLAYRLLYEYLTWKWFFNTIYKKLIISYNRYFINKICFKICSHNIWAKRMNRKKTFVEINSAENDYRFDNIFLLWYVFQTDGCIDFLLFTVFFGLDVFLGETKIAQRILSSLSWDI